MENEYFYLDDNLKSFPIPESVVRKFKDNVDWRNISFHQTL